MLSRENVPHSMRRKIPERERRGQGTHQRGVRLLRGGDVSGGGWQGGLKGGHSLEIKRHLLLGRKVMTNLDSIVKRLLSKGLSRIFTNTTVPKHQFFGAQLSL